MALVVLLGVAAIIAIAGFRYVPLIEDVRIVRATALRLADEAGSLGSGDLDRASVDRLRADVAELDARLAPVRGLLSGDPLVGLARAVPAGAVQVRAAEDLVGAAESLVEAGQIGIGLADAVVTLRETNESEPEFALLPGLVELMATSGDQVDRIAELLEDAGTRLAAIPDEAVPQIREARDMAAEPLATYAPLLDTYRELDDVLPDLLGWGDEKRYLVLAQNPAELRPTGGYTGTVGVVALRDGAVVEQRFLDTYELSRQEGLPFVEPPEALAEYLLGEEQSWRLADANWSPDFPTAAQKALELYQLETGDADIDGVIAVTTFGFDRLLEVVGAVEVPDYAVTVQPGDVTMTLLSATRGTESNIDDRKDVLDVLAREATSRLLSLPPELWEEMLVALADIGEQRDALVWLRDEDGQRFVAEAGWAGAVRQDPGDYLYVVESNVAPTSKYNLVIDRADSLVVTLDEEGDAVNRLRLDWQNRADGAGEPYESLREFSINQIGWYGAHVRVLTPKDSKLISARGQGLDPIRGAERGDPEAGRAVFANGLLMAPGPSRMTYRWRVPGAAVQTEAGWLYELVVQKQPGARSLPVSIEVRLPEGAVVRETSEGAVADGQVVRLQANLTTDVELRVLYDLPSRADSG